jgi:hypothetical protein
MYEYSLGYLAPGGDRRVASPSPCASIIFTQQGVVGAYTKRALELEDFAKGMDQHHGHIFSKSSMSSYYIQTQNTSSNAGRSAGEDRQTG